MMSTMSMSITLALLNVAGGLCLAFAFRPSKEWPPGCFRWGYGTQVAFNRDLFRLGLAFFVLGAVGGVFR